MISAIGAVFLSKSTGRLMLNLRASNVSYPNHFGFVGGKIENEENILEALDREIYEEIGTIPEPLDQIPFDVFLSEDGKFKYYSILIIVEDEFIPRLNEESAGYCWVNIGNYPKPLHPGAKPTLLDQNLINDFISVWNAQKKGELFINSLLD